LSGWILAIDVGTTSTAAARRVGDRVETIQLQGGPRMPSLAFWREGTGASGTGRLVLGVEADELSALAPWCLERAPKSRLGEEFIQLIDLASRFYESKSPDEYRRGMEEVRTKMFEVFKDQSDAQLRDFQKTAEKWFDVFAKA